jgi:hypothetical protein
MLRHLHLPHLRAGLLHKFSREDDRSIERDGKAAVSAAQHDGTDDQLRERAHRARQRKVFLFFSVATRRKERSKTVDGRGKYGEGDDSLRVCRGRARLYHRPRRFQRLCCMYTLVEAGYQPGNEGLGAQDRRRTNGEDGKPRYIFGVS